MLPTVKGASRDSFAVNRGGKSTHFRSKPATTHCVAADIVAQGGGAEDAERYLRGAQWLDARSPNGYTTVTRWVDSKLVSRVYVPNGSEA